MKNKWEKNNEVKCKLSLSLTCMGQENLKISKNTTKCCLSKNWCNIPIFGNIVQKISLFQLFVLEIHSFLWLTKLTTPIFGHSYPKNYWSKFNFFELVSKCKKSGYSTDLFWRFRSFINTAIWLAVSILAHIPGTRFSPNIDYVQKHNISFHYRTNLMKIKD